MNAAPADQLRLVELADLEDRIAQAEALRRTPPQAARVKELLGRRQELSHELTLREGAREDLRRELARIESDVALVQARRDRDAVLLDTVTSPRDAAGIEHELASLVARTSALEDAQLEVMERIEHADAEVVAQETLIAETNEEGARLSAEAKTAVAEASALSDRLTGARDALRASVPPPLLTLFDRLRTRGVGAALLRARTCAGCNMVLSGTDLQELRQAADDVVVTCPECGCVLVRTAESGL